MFVVLDTETTGLYPYRGHEMISFAGIKIDKHLNEIDRLVIKIHPARPDLFDPEAKRINGYQTHLWRDAIQPQEAIEKIASFMSGCVPVAHNWAFDRAFLFAMLKNTGVDRRIPRRGIDTITLATSAFYRFGIRSFSMQSMCDLLGWPKQPHRAEADAVLCLALFRLLYPITIRTAIKIQAMITIAKIRKLFKPI